MATRELTLPIGGSEGEIFETRLGVRAGVEG